MEYTYFLISLYLLIFVLWFWNYKKKVGVFPVLNILLQFVRCKLTGKISKDTPLNNVIFEELIEMGKRHSKEGLFMMFTYHPVLFIYSTEAIKFFANEKAALDKPSEYQIVEDALGSGIFTSNGEQWKRHRKMINPAFHMGVLKEKISIFNKYGIALVKDMEKLAGKHSVHILDALKLPSLYALSEAVLGLKQDYANKEKVLELARCVDNIASMIIKRGVCPWFRWKFLLRFFPSGRKFLQETVLIEDFINDILTDMKKWIILNGNENDQHSGNNFRKSFTYILLTQHLSNPNEFTLKDLHDEVKTIIGSGFHTTSYTAMWCLYFLGTHPEIQEKVFHEIQSATNDYITYEESCNLVYLEAVIMETLRLHPTAPIFGRNVSEDIQYNKYTIFKGTSVFYFPYLSQRDPKLYPDPEKFDPERFLNGDAKKTLNFIPFGEGSRNCIGKNYALMEMKIFLAHILRNFKITCLDRREDIKLCWTIVISPVKSLNFRITPRNCMDLNSP